MEILIMKLFIRKVLKNLLPIYAIRFFAIQEKRCTLGNDLTLQGVIDRLLLIFHNFINLLLPLLKLLLNHNWFIGR